MFYKKVG